MVVPMDQERVLTVLYYLKSGKSFNCSNRFKSSQKRSIEAEMMKIRSLEEEEYKLQMAPLIAFFIQALVNRNDKIPAPHQGSNVCPSFNAQTPPSISIEEYLLRIIRYTPCSPECFLLAVIYMDDIIRNHNMLLTTLNVHRFLITSILIAAKLYDDTTYNNKYYAHVGGVPLKELNSLELKFVTLLDFNLIVATEFFDQYKYEAEINLAKGIDLSFQQQQEEEDSEDDSQDSGVAYDEDVMEDSNLYRARQNSSFIVDNIRRSRSFTNITEGGIFKWRKRRSTSFNVLGVNT